jgi:glycosyltransferase involved in cell wall biosynthesis
MNQYNNSPLVSVITITYNSVMTLQQTIESVISQSYTNIEYIIIDGCSTDGSVGIIENYKDKLTYWISEKDNGIYDAMNKGLSKAKGDLISILNSDDWYEPDAIEKVINACIFNRDVDVFHGLLRFIDNKGNPDLITGHYESFLDRGMIEHPTCFIKSSLYQKVGKFNNMYKSAADYDWMLRAKAAGAQFFLIPQIITNFRRGGVSDSQKGFQEELSIKRSYGLITKFKYSYWKLYSKFLSIIKS